MMKNRKKLSFLLLLASVALYFFPFSVAHAECCVIGSGSGSTCYSILSATDCFTECRTRNSSGSCYVVSTDTTCSSQSNCGTVNQSPLQTASLSQLNSSIQGSGVSVTIGIDNPLAFNTVQDLAGNVLSTLRSIIVILSILFIVLGGVLYITSAGDEKRMTVAKGAIFASVVGLALGIAAPSFLLEIYTLLGGANSGSGITPPQAVTLTQIVTNVLNFLLAIVGILALIMLIVGGIMYLTSTGDEDRIKSAKKIVTYAIIGIAVSLASLVVVRQISDLLQ